MLRTSLSMIALTTGLYAGCSSTPPEPTSAVGQNIAGGYNDAESRQADVVVELDNQNCSGTLITPTVVLTAGHCINGDTQGKRGLPLPITVSIGNTVAGALGHYQATRAVTAIPGPLVCDSFTPCSVGSDLALLFLQPGQFAIESPNNPTSTSAQPYIVHPTLLGPDSSMSIGQAGWAQSDSATYRQIAFDSNDNTGHDDDDPGNGWNSWEHSQGSIHVDAGDSGGPLFVLRTDSRGNVYRDVFGVLSGTWSPAIGSDKDEYADITNQSPAGNAWLLSQLVDTTRTSRWRAQHPSYAWFGDVEYTGPCDTVNDTDCDHWTNAHDNCPTTYNPDQNDTADTGVGDACLVTITNVSPNQGPVGTGVTITGTGFVPGNMEFQWVTNVSCASSTTCTGTISNAPLQTATVHLSGIAGSGATVIYSQPTNNDEFTIYGAGGTGCTGDWLCEGSNDNVTAANFSCPTESVGYHYQLERQTSSGFIDVATSVTYTGGPLTSGPTILDEFGYIPLATETSLTYDVCLVNNTTGERSCGGAITLGGTTDHCTCEPTTCDMESACQTTISNLCGGTLSCGACSAGLSCVNHVCQEPGGGGGGDCTPAMAKRHQCS